MFVIAVLCISIGLAASQTYNANTCGLRPLKPNGEQDFDKIVGGNESLPGDWPWSCSMRLNGGHICGGSLIASKWIVGAAHCVSGTVTNPGVYTWACGIHVRTQSASYTQIFTTIRVVRHPSYSAQTLTNDIAVFELATEAELTDYVLPVCVPPTGAVFAGQTSVATGWGSEFSGGGSSRVHREVSLPVQTDAQCKQGFVDQGLDIVVPATQVCAGAEGGGKDTCQGDSGGPLVVKNTNWQLIGLTSWGIGCGNVGVYTRVSAFYDWILSYTGTLPTGG